MPIGKVGHDAFLTGRGGKFLEAEYLSFDLNERHLAVEFVNMINLTSVYIFIRIGLQQVPPRADTQFIDQYRLLLGANPGKIHDILVKNRAHRKGDNLDEK